MAAGLKSKETKFTWADNKLLTHIHKMHISQVAFNYSQKWLQPEKIIHYLNPSLVHNAAAPVGKYIEKHRL